MAAGSSTTRFAPSHLRVRLALLVLLAVLPLLALVIYNAVEQRRQGADMAQAEALRLARVVAAEQERVRAGLGQMLAMLIRVPQVATARQGECAAFLAGLIGDYPYLTNIGVARRDGDVTCSAIPLRQRINIRDRAYFQRALARGGFAEGDFQVGRVTGRPSVAFAYPLPARAGEPAGVVFAALDLGWFGRLAERVGLPAGSTLTVVDPSGTVLTSYPDPQGWVGRAASDQPLVAAMRARPEGVDELAGLDGTPRLFGFTRAGSEHIAIGLPAELVTLPADRQLLRSLLALAAVALAAFAIAWAGATVLVLRPVRALLQATARVAGGDLRASTGIPPGQGELGQLARAFDGMVASLARLTARTAEQAALLDKAHDAICVWDLDERIRYWNKGAEQLYGWQAGQAAGRLAPELLAGALVAEHQAARAALDAAGIWTGELHQVAQDGRELIVECHWTLVRDDAGEPRSVLVIATDLTAKKQLEAQSLRSQRMESIGKLAGGIAHDLNNILAPILMVVEVFREKFPDPQSQHLLGILGRCAERGAGMVKQVLSFARGVEGEHMLLDPRQLVRDLEGMLRETFPKSIYVEATIPDRPWAVDGDSTQLYQVLMNLSVNARDAMPGGGKLRLAVDNVTLVDDVPPECRPGRYLCLVVSDTGAGMPAEVQARIFEPFFTTKPPGQGTGIGLSTTAEIVRNHGGFVRVASDPGRGTIFSVYLPAADTDAEGAPAVEAVLPLGHGETILVVDDEASILEIAKETLETYGYRVLTAGDGSEAIAVYARHRDAISVVLTDTQMPFMDGPSTVRALRKLAPTLRIISASGTSSQPSMGAPEANAYLSKPYTAERLLKTLDDVLRAPPT